MLADPRWGRVLALGRHIGIRDGWERNSAHPQPAARFDDTGDDPEVRMLGADAADYGLRSMVTRQHTGT